MNVREKSSVLLDAEKPFRSLLLKNGHLLPILKLLGLHGPYGEKSIRQICNEQNFHESVFLALLMVCTEEDFRMKESLPTYGLLRISELYGALLVYLRDVIEKWSLRLDELCIQKAADLGNTVFSKKLRRCNDIMDAHISEWKEKASPHILFVYELYYSPDFTSGKNDLLQYSMEFFPMHLLPVDCLKVLGKELEERFFSTGMELVYEYLVFIELVCSAERIERLLIRQMVLQMEDAVMTTFHKRRDTFVRRAYLPVPKEKIVPNELTPREQEVLCLMAQGFMNKEMADELHISLTTVISHRKHIVDKLGIRTLAGLTVYAYTHGYIDDVLTSPHK